MSEIFGTPEPLSDEEYINSLSRDHIVDEIQRLQAECERLRDELKQLTQKTCACRYTLAMELETECEYHRRKRQAHEEYKQMILSVKRKLEESEKPFYEGMEILNQLTTKK